MSGKQNIWDEVKLVFETNENFKLSSQFMLNRIISFCGEGFEAAVYANKFIGRMPDSFMLRLYRSMIETGRAPYINYVKKPKVEEPKLLEKICRKYCCRELHARQIIDIYRRKGVDPEKLFGLKRGE